MKRILIFFVIILGACHKNNETPVANAGNDQSVKEGKVLTLDGSMSSDPDGDALTFQWTAPAEISLSSGTSIRPTFIAPEVVSDTQYPIILVVSDGEAYSIADTVIISVSNEDKFLKFIIAGQTEGTGIRFVDFEPDEELVYSSSAYDKFLDLDIDNDGTDDFNLHYRSFHGDIYYQITPSGDGCICVSKDIKGTYAESFVLGDTIGSNDYWLKGKTNLFTKYLACYTDYQTGERICSESGYGNWLTQNNIFVGVKIKKDEKEFFGWIDLTVHSVRRFGITRPY